jgi:hypothetical protein
MHHRIRTIAVALVAAAWAGALGGACANSRPGTADAPHDAGDRSPAHIIDMPNGYMNLAFKCNGADGIYAHRRDASPVVIPNDPNCPKASNG